MQDIILGNNIADNAIDDHVYHFAENLQVTHFSRKEETSKRFNDTTTQDYQVENCSSFSNCKVNAISPSGHAQIQEHRVEADKCET